MMCFVLAGPLGCGSELVVNGETVGLDVALVDTQTLDSINVDETIDVAAPSDLTRPDDTGVDPCPRGFEPCGETCVDKSIAQDDCGECGVSCGPEEHCRQGECVSGGVIFSLDVAPLLLGFSCSDCHRFMSPSGLVNVPARGTGCRGQMRVAPGDPDSSALVTLISGRSCGVSMPPTGKTMSDDEIELVRRWISAGALDN